ncbi:hypothetical protein Shyd_88270 [Streptomyces hydrogenans]|uniref:Uncharacterized protein n=1 Tax=Streptomyces hydrogenans TaxID=1873719 RepID=A0ABQ3PR04_9ACTN|nr:hypothetical protein GCM10018784_08550 [Streptomyces hydrogenans]GHI27456.1 hypothetical protein Shyd_88270 [Streptomyces hydrogenans]
METAHLLRRTAGSSPVGLVVPLRRHRSRRRRPTGHRDAGVMACVACSGSRCCGARRRPVAVGASEGGAMLAAQKATGNASRRRTLYEQQTRAAEEVVH